MCWSPPYIGERISGFMQTGREEAGEKLTSTSANAENWEDEVRAVEDLF